MVFFNYRVLVFTDKLIFIVFSLNIKYVFELQVLDFEIPTVIEKLGPC